MSKFTDYLRSKVPGGSLKGASQLPFVGMAVINEFSAMEKPRAANVNEISFTPEEIAALDKIVSRGVRSGLFLPSSMNTGYRDALYTLRLSQKTEPNVVFYVLKDAKDLFPRYRLHGPKDITEVGSINFEDILRVAKNLVRRDFSPTLALVQPA